MRIQRAEVDLDKVFMVCAMAWLWGSFTGVVLGVVGLVP